MTSANPESKMVLSKRGIHRSAIWGKFEEETLPLLLSK